MNSVLGTTTSNSNLNNSNSNRGKSSLFNLPENLRSDNVSSSSSYTGMPLLISNTYYNQNNTNPYSEPFMSNSSSHSMLFPSK